MRISLRKQLGEFLRKRRGKLTYAEFARRIGLSSSTLQRIETGEQNVTLDTLQHLVARLRCRLSEIFPE